MYKKKLWALKSRLLTFKGERQRQPFFSAPKLLKTLTDAFAFHSGIMKRETRAVLFSPGRAGENFCLKPCDKVICIVEWRRRCLLFVLWFPTAWFSTQGAYNILSHSFDPLSHSHRDHSYIGMLAWCSSVKAFLLELIYSHSRLYAISSEYSRPP